MKKNSQNMFWNEFSQKYWEKKPLLVKKFKSPVFEINEIEIFKMLANYSSQCRKAESAEGFKLYIDGQMLHPAETLQFLPQPSDKSLMGYHQRMETYFSDYCLVCDELLQVSQENWSKLQDFTNTLFSHVGFPNRFVEMGLYLGNYRKTPFGVHVDGCGVFSFPIIGHKTFRLWKPRFAQKNPALNRALNYGRFKNSSTVMKASYGDMTYWPSTAWHIAESNGSFNATWSLGVWVDRTHLENVESAIKPLLKIKHGTHGSETVTKNINLQNTGQIKSLPQNYIKSIHSIKNITEKELYDTFMHAWLKLLSQQGFKTSNSSNKITKISLQSKLQLPKSKFIYWSQLKLKNKKLYAYNGKTLEIKPSVSFQNLINTLNAGQSCVLSQYLKGPHRLTELKHLKTLLMD